MHFLEVRQSLAFSIGPAWLAFEGQWLQPRMERISKYMLKKKKFIYLPIFDTLLH